MGFIPLTGKHVLLSREWDNRYQYYYIGEIVNLLSRSIEVNLLLEINYVGTINTDLRKFWFRDRYFTLDNIKAFVPREAIEETDAKKILAYSSSLSKC